MSLMVSPFVVEERETSSLVTAPPRFFIAHSKLLSVRVEFSKKMVMIFLPSSVCGSVCGVWGVLSLLVDFFVAFAVLVAFVAFVVPKVESKNGKNSLALNKIRSTSSLLKSFVWIRCRCGKC